MNTIEINEKVQQKNDTIAEANRHLFAQSRVLNMIGSPGCGKTAILEKTAAILRDKLAVIVGDVKTDLDAQRVEKHGSEAIGIETDGGCHLNAQMIAEAFDKLKGKTPQVIVIENVGNLVCPSTYDLGENAKVAVLSLPEGDEKPCKYPALFLRADCVLINKIDLKEFLDYDIERAKGDCKKLNPKVKIIELSAKTGEGFEEWIDYLTG